MRRPSANGMQRLSITRIPLAGRVELEGSRSRASVLAGLLRKSLAVKTRRTSGVEIEQVLDASERSVVAIIRYSGHYPLP